MRLNARARESLEEIQLLTVRVIGDLCGTARQHISALYRLSEAGALLDLLCSHAT